MILGESSPAFLAVGNSANNKSKSTINGILAMRSFKDQFSTGYVDPKKGGPDLTPQQISIVVAILSAGTFAGSLISAPFGDLIGRRLSIIAAIGVFIFGVIFQVCADALPLLLAGRYVVSNGLMC
jgi:MFS family permease